jgi:hypothetical protein
VVDRHREREPVVLEEVDRREAAVDPAQVDEDDAAPGAPGQLVHAHGQRGRPRWSAAGSARDLAIGSVCVLDQRRCEEFGDVAE